MFGIFRFRKCPPADLLFRRFATCSERHLPRIHDTIKRMLDGNLDKKAFPYIRTPVKETTLNKTTRIVSRRKRGNDKKANTASAAEKNPRFIIFMLGGVTASEMRSIYALGEEYGVDLILGSTVRLLPTFFSADFFSRFSSADFFSRFFSADILIFR
jgi:hypothetical protein